MKKELILLLITIILSGISTAQLGLFGSNEEESGDVLNILTGSASGTNVTSVTSSTNCITSSPTTNDVILTFNTSCAGNSSGSGGGNVSGTGHDTNTNLAFWTSPMIISYANNLIWDNINQFLGINVPEPLYPLDVYGVQFRAEDGGDYVYLTDDITGSNFSLRNRDDGETLTLTYGDSDIVTFTNRTRVGIGRAGTEGSPLPFMPSNTLDVRGDINASGNIYYDNVTLVGNVRTNSSGQIIARVFCGNITGNNLCPTGNPTFNNLTVNERLINNCAGISCTWQTFAVLGGAIPIGTVTSVLGVFQYKSESNLDIYFSNDDTTGLFSVNDLGETFARSLRTFYIDSGVGSKSFESNNTRTTIYSNSSFRGVFNNITGNLNVQGNSTMRNLTVSLDVCITSGKCLNQSVTLNSNPAFNNTMIYWSNDTKTWNSIPEPPTHNEAPVYCTSASVGRWTFLDNTAGVCPL